MEEEKDEAVVRELILALGRIGSPDAVQRSSSGAADLSLFSGGNRARCAWRRRGVAARGYSGGPGHAEGLSDDATAPSATRHRP